MPVAASASESESFDDSGFEFDSKSVAKSEYASVDESDSDSSLTPSLYVSPPPTPISSRDRVRP